MPISIDDTRGQGYTLHTVYRRRQPLGVECTGCGHRALALGDKLDELKGDMTEVRALRFRCTACGSSAWKGWLFNSASEAEAWIEGLVVSPMGGDGIDVRL